MQMLAYGPERLGFGFASNDALKEPQVRERLADLLAVMTHANGELDDLIAARETILCERDPSRQRVYNFDGRDVVFDVENGKVRYLDDPEADEVLVIEAVDPSSEPTREFLRTFKRERERQRERRR